MSRGKKYSISLGTQCILLRELVGILFTKYSRREAFDTESREGENPLTEQKSGASQLPNEEQHGNRKKEKIMNIKQNIIWQK